MSHWKSQEHSMLLNESIGHLDSANSGILDGQIYILLEVP